MKSKNNRDNKNKNVVNRNIFNIFCNVEVMIKFERKLKYGINILWVEGKLYNM